MMLVFRCFCFEIFFCFVLKQTRTPTSITVDELGRTEEYELLAILDFNNVRKRMSVSDQRLIRTRTLND